MKEFIEHDRVDVSCKKVTSYTQDSANFWIIIIIIIILVTTITNTTTCFNHQKWWEKKREQFCDGDNFEGKGKKKKETGSAGNKLRHSQQVYKWRRLDRSICQVQGLATGICQIDCQIKRLFCSRPFFFFLGQCTLFALEVMTFFFVLLFAFRSISRTQWF